MTIKASYLPETIGYLSGLGSELAVGGYGGFTVATDGMPCVAAILPPAKYYIERYGAPGTAAFEFLASGLLVIVSLDTSPAQAVPKYYDLATGQGVYLNNGNTVVANLAVTGDADGLTIGIVPMNGANLGFWLYGSKISTGANNILGYRQSSYSFSAPAGWGSENMTSEFVATDFADQGGVLESGVIAELCPIAKYEGLRILAAMANHTAGSPHVILFNQTTSPLAFNAAVPASSADTISVLFAKEYASGAQNGPHWGGTGLVTWATRPDSCLSVWNLPNRPDLSAILLGDWVASPKFHMAVSAPRLALIDTSNGNIHMAQNAGTGNAHGMCVSHDGRIYVTGTKSLVGSTENLIECYGFWDLTAPLHAVAHEANGLGSYYADAANTHVMSPMWAGNHLLVFDHDLVKTRCFVYDKDLNYITKFTIGENLVLAQADYEWFASGSGTNEYYLALAGSGGATAPDLSTTRPGMLVVSEAMMTAGTLGSLSAGQWGYGDNDTLGFSTVYVRLADGSDPNNLADGVMSLSAAEYGTHWRGGNKCCAWMGLHY